jgi:hypothetical protein
MISDASRNGLLFMNGPLGLLLNLHSYGTWFLPWHRSHVPKTPPFGIYFLSAC